MSTATAHVRTHAEYVLPGRRYDHIFFSGMALLMLATAFVGFARSYYLAGVFHAPLPSRLVHIHGAAFSAWVVLVVTQTSLVSAGRVDIHRRLGIGGFLLACFMVVLGVMTATESLSRPSPVGGDVKAFYIFPMTSMLIFSVLIFWAYRMRSNPAAHKRLILAATTALMIAAISRWPVAFVQRRPPEAALVTYVFLLMMVGHDLWSTHKVHQATIWASAFLIIVQRVAFPFGHTAAWHAFATWAQGTGH